MRKLVQFLALSVAAMGLVAAPVPAADQTVLGKSISVKAKPGDPSKTKITGSAAEKDSPNTLVGDPTAAGSAGGAILTIFANGGTSTVQSFILGQGTSSNGKPFWSGDAVKGFKYKDAKGEQGAVKSAEIKLRNGSFSIKASLSGKNGLISIMPPNPGTDACLAVQLGVDGTSGDRYSVQFGPESKITNKGDVLFKATKPVNEGVCPGGPPSTTTTTTAPPTTTTTAPPTTTTTAPPTTTTTAPPTTTTTAPPTTTTTTAPPTTTTTSTTTTSTTSTTIGSPSGAFLAAADGSD